MIDRIKKRIENLDQATEGATVIEPRIYPVASEATIQAAEAELGLRLPALLRELYKQVGNGGYGPGYGLMLETRYARIQPLEDRHD
jgi:cell wall assembly regulator SMI1